MNIANIIQARITTAEKYGYCDPPNDTDIIAIITVITIQAITSLN